MSKGFTHESTYNESKEWDTPRWLFRALGIQFNLDPCSPGQDVVPWIPAEIHLTIRDDGLTHKWWDNVWMNPPYGSDTPKWMKRLSQHGNGIALVFARPDTKWFHDYVPLADAICFPKGRIAFVPAESKAGTDYPALYADGLWEPKGGCGAASMLIAFGEENAEALYKSNLGLALPVKKALETFSDEDRFAGDSSVRNEQPPPLMRTRPSYPETGQGTLFKENSDGQCSKKSRETVRNLGDT